MPPTAHRLTPLTDSHAGGRELSAVVGGYLLRKRELLAALRALHSANVFQYLTPEEQVLVTELVAAAEACKLTAFATEVGNEAIARLIVHLPAQDETLAQRYITNHINGEAAGTCRVESLVSTTARH